jgi:hypothetical protein
MGLPNTSKFKIFQVSDTTSYLDIHLGISDHDLILQFDSTSLPTIFTDTTSFRNLYKDSYFTRQSDCTSVKIYALLRDDAYYYSIGFNFVEADQGYFIYQRSI